MRLYVSKNHPQNWLDCIKSRKLPVCDVEIGHRSATVCHLGNIAVRTGPQDPVGPGQGADRRRRRGRGDGLRGRTARRGSWRRLERATLWRAAGVIRLRLHAVALRHMPLCPRDRLGQGLAVPAVPEVAGRRPLCKVSAAAGGGTCAGFVHDRTVSPNASASRWRWRCPARSGRGRRGQSARGRPFCRWHRPTAAAWPAT